MSMKDIMPMDIEITLAEEYDKQSVESLSRLQDAEDGVTRAVKDLAERFDRATKERERYLNTQKELERQYIQLIQRKSELIAPIDMQKLKEHTKNLEETIQAYITMSQNLKELSSSYNEYNGALKDLVKAWGNQQKTEMDWRKLGYDFTKARESQDGGKMEKIEKQLGKTKQDTIKTFQEKAHRATFVEKAMVRINQSWQKIKVNIKNIAW